MLRVVLSKLVSSAAEKSQRKQPQNIRQNLNHQGDDSGGFFILQQVWMLKNESSISVNISAAYSELWCIYY